MGELLREPRLLRRRGSLLNEILIVITVLVALAVVILDLAVMHLVAKIWRRLPGR